MAVERPTQQRVIDSVTISIEATTPVTPEPSFSTDLLRIHIGEGGHGDVTVWIHRSEAHRVIAAIAQAIGLPPAEPRGLGGSAFVHEDIPEPVAVAEKDAVPF